MFYSNIHQSVFSVLSSLDSFHIPYFAPIVPQFHVVGFRFIIFALLFSFPMAKDPSFFFAWKTTLNFSFPRFHLSLWNIPQFHLLTQICLLFCSTSCLNFSLMGHINSYLSPIQISKPPIPRQISLCWVKLIGPLVIANHPSRTQFVLHQRQSDLLRPFQFYGSLDYPIYWTLELLPKLLCNEF